MNGDFFKQFMYSWMDITYYKSKSRFSINSIPVFLFYKYKHKRSCYKISRWEEQKDFFRMLPFIYLKFLLVICQKSQCKLFLNSMSCPQLSIASNFFSVIESKELANTYFERDLLHSCPNQSISPFLWSELRKGFTKAQQNTANNTCYSLTQWYFV